MKKNTLIFTMGGKGGVGKTLSLLALADTLDAAGIPFAAIDADSENAGKPSAFSSFLSDAAKPNLRSIADCDRLLTVAAEHSLTLVDLPANAGGDFHGWFASVATPETLDALNLQLVAVGAITPEPATFPSVAEWAAALQNSCRYVVVLNRRTLARVDKTLEETFPEYYTGKAAAAFRKAFSPLTVELPGLFEGSAAALLRAGKLPSSLEEETPILDRTRVKTWAAACRQNWTEALKAIQILE